WPLVAPLLQAQDFYRADHRLLFGAIAELSGGADVVTLYAHLERQGIADQAGGMAYMSRLVRETLSTRNAEEYARVVRERAQLRGLADIARRLETAATEYGTSAEEVVADFERRISELRSRAKSDGGL